MKTYDGALEIIKKYETFRADAYQDSAGIWTIGYGTTLYSNNLAVLSTDNISHEKAVEEMCFHIEKRIMPVINKELQGFLNDNQRQALISFIYNIGTGAFLKSTMFKKLQVEDLFGASKEFDRWVYSKGKKLRGLIRRRKEERALFEKPPVLIFASDQMSQHEKSLAIRFINYLRKV